MEFSSGELLYISECLISYQSVLLDIRKNTFGSMSDAITAQIEKISEINNRIIKGEKDGKAD